MGLTGRSPLGRAKVKLAWQLAPLGTPFTASSGVIAGRGASWTDVLTTGLALTATVDGLSPDTAYHWCARLLYHPGNRLGQPAGRWVHVPWNGWSETDLRNPDVVDGVQAAFTATADTAATDTAATADRTTTTDCKAYARRLMTRALNHSIII